MKLNAFPSIRVSAAVIFAVAIHASAAEQGLRLMPGQDEVLQVEPILVSLQVEDRAVQSLPAAPGSALRFEIDPPVNPRNNGQPLPLEAATEARVRNYDLLEWYQFPAEGKFTVKAVYEADGKTFESSPVTFTIRKPAGGDPEQPAVGRIHHPPWCNYGKNKFCGDTFDTVKRWPDSQLAKHCHYWNGRFLQNQQKFDEAILSYRAAAQAGDDFALTDDARFGIVECLVALGNNDEARKQNSKLLSSEAGTAVHALATKMAERLEGLAAN